MTPIILSCALLISCQANNGNLQTQSQDSAISSDDSTVLSNIHNVTISYSNIKEKQFIGYTENRPILSISDHKIIAFFDHEYVSGLYSYNPDWNPLFINDSLIFLQNVMNYKLCVYNIGTSKSFYFEFREKIYSLCANSQSDSVILETGNHLVLLKKGNSVYSQASININGGYVQWSSGFYYSFYTDPPSTVADVYRLGNLEPFMKNVYGENWRVIDGKYFVGTTHGSINKTKLIDLHTKNETVIDSIGIEYDYLLWKNKLIQFHPNKPDIKIFPLKLSNSDGSN